MSEAIIQTKGLSTGYKLRNGRRKIIHERLDVSLYAGEVTCLLGLNGAGKSTLLRTLCGFQPPLAGEVYLLGKPLKDYSQSSFSLTVGVVLTEKTNAGGITVFDLVSLGRHPYTGFFGQLKQEDRRVIERSLEMVGIAHKAGQFVGELSDGERQKAMIAKTLAQECPIILLDEPTAFLDVTSRIETMLLLKKLASGQNKTILLSTHDMELAIQMGDRLWLLEKGRPMHPGTPEDLILNGELESFFSKEGIQFDPSTGKLSAIGATEPVGVEGEFRTAYWVGNALLRNGYQPGVVCDGQPNIICVDKNHIRLQVPGQETIRCHSVEELIDYLPTIKNNESV